MTTSQPFAISLLRFKDTKTNRDDSLKWARRLRFLDISEVPNLEQLRKDRESSRVYNSEGWTLVAPPGRLPKLSIPIVEEDEEDDEPPTYLAVSWKWINRADSVTPRSDVIQSFRYFIQRPESSAHVSSFPDRYMDRVIRVAHSHRSRRYGSKKNASTKRTEMRPCIREIESSVCKSWTWYTQTPSLELL
jgi:hypothetical protein